MKKDHVKSDEKKQVPKEQTNDNDKTDADSDAGAPDFANLLKARSAPTTTGHNPEINVEEIDFNAMKRMSTSKRETIRKSDSGGKK